VSSEHVCSLMQQVRAVSSVGTCVRLALVLLLLAVVLFAAATARAATGTTEYDYVKVSDGTEIAISIWYPAGFSKTDGKRWPALFEMDGYGGARNVNDTQFHGRTSEYVVVYASVRGTGCSGGRFDLFSDRSAQDGHEVIEDWLVRQPWSNGRVGITGHSYSGLTGFAVAETAPPHVKAVAVSGLIDDLYRGILYMGGIPNAGFPIVWGGAARAALEAQANLQPQLTDDRCRTNFLQHEASDYAPATDLFLATYTGSEAAEDSYAIRQGLMRRVGAIRAPTQVGQQYQDEQTGPRGGPVLWEHLNRKLPKRLVLSNGRHNPNDPSGTKDEWLRCWVIQRGEDCGTVTDKDARVLMHFDSRRREDGTGQERSKPYATSNFPAPETAWRRWALDARTYVSASTDHHMTANPGLALAEDQNTGAITFAGDPPTQARWALPFTQDTPISGPIAMTLWATTTAPDTDFFVDVLDRDTTTGELRYLQRGMLRGSFREVDLGRSDRVRRGPHKGEIWRPYHPFVHPQQVTPLQPTRFEIEIFPLGHVFRAGHELVLQLHAPPPNDPLSIGTYPPQQAPAVVQVLQDPQHPTSVLLPVLPQARAPWALPSCVRSAGPQCFTPAG
jgi:predicted acyl esterase